MCNFLTVFKGFLRKFPIFHNKGFSAEMSINCDSMHIKYSVPIIEGYDDFEAKMGQNEEGQNAQLFIKLSALAGLKLNYDLYRLQSF